MDAATHLSGHPAGQPDEQPGLVCGIYREEKVGSSIECEGDAIGEPIAVSPDAAMSIQVLV